MAKKAAQTLEEVGDERDQAVFLAMVKLWYNGDIDAAFKDRAKFVNEFEESAQPNKAKQTTTPKSIVSAEIRVNLSSQ